MTPDLTEKITQAIRKELADIYQADIYRNEYNNAHLIPGLVKAVCEVVGTPRVKMLVWTYVPANLHYDGWTAESLNGGYMISRVRGKFELWIGDEIKQPHGVFDTLELAKDAAQSLYSQAILTALEPEAFP